MTSEISIVGADFSSLLQQEANNQKFLDHEAEAPLETILGAHGVNYSRIRLWVDPEPGSNDLATALTLAERSAGAGMQILLDLHFSDTWADKSNQEAPAAWATFDQKEMVAAVRSYTEDVVRAFAEQGTPVSMVQLGNEVTNGILWSWGKIDQPWGEYWEGFAELHEAGVAGAIAASPASPPRIMIHLHGGGDSRSVGRFLEKAQDHGMTFDVVGVTYYPFWNGSLDQLGRFLHFVAERYDRDVLVVETGYPWTLDDPAHCSNVVDEAEDLPTPRSHPPTPKGQSAYFEDLRAVLQSVPDGHGLGFVVWEPAWLPDVRLAGNVCNRYAALTLFDWHGNALPALDRLAQ
ncbi:glycoside hydrolase family 53 protein [Kocuria sp. CH-021]|uniref:glycoside hydrolase family 53 protein n=1 Tax=Kocuria sp. CH-021 TaxID=3406735 RepID=UPI003C735ACD